MKELSVCKRSKSLPILTDAKATIRRSKTFHVDDNLGPELDGDWRIGVDHDLQQSNARPPHNEFLPEIVETSHQDRFHNLPTNSHPRVPLETNINRTGLIWAASSKHSAPEASSLYRERPERIASIRKVLEKESLIDRCVQLNACGCSELKLLESDLFEVHHSSYVQRLQKLSHISCNLALKREAEQYQSVYLTPHSWTEAREAALSLCRLVLMVSRGQLDNGFAIVRPPGHHAEPHMAGGFCIINNVAVATNYAMQQLGMKKVLIVDYDIHHGNGTTKIFDDNPHVVCFSIHTYLRRRFYPFDATGSLRHVGDGDGKGYTVNIGWSRTGMGDNEYMCALDRILMPIAREFKPDLILVSAGFDGADGDIYDGRLSPDGFAAMTRRLMELGPVVCTLEGGYVLSVLGECVAAVIAALLGKQGMCDYDDVSSIDPVAAQDIQTTLHAHKPYWKCFQQMDENQII